MKFHVAVMSRDAAQSTLDLDTRGEVTHVISIGDRNDPGPPLRAGSRPVLRLAFDDVSRPHPGYYAPQPRHVARIIAFARAIPTGAGLLVHCAAGISRSPAAAIIALLAVHDPHSARGIVKHAFRACRSTDTPQPNLLMLQHAEAQLRYRPGTVVGLVERERRMCSRMGY